MLKPERDERVGEKESNRLFEGKKKENDEYVSQKEHCVLPLAARCL